LGESTTIAHAIFIIVSVMMASVLALVVLAKLSYVESIFSETIKEKADALGLRLMIVNAYRNSTSGVIYVYVKNVGTTPFRGIESIDLYMGNYTGPLDYYHYNATLQPGEFNYTELGGADGVWSPGETIRFNVDPLHDYGDLVRVRIVLPNGVTAEDVVELPRG